MKHETQTSRLLEYLKQGHSITPLEALHLFGSLRLSALIFELKKRGYRIRTDMVQVENGKRVAKYTMED